MIFGMSTLFCEEQLLHTFKSDSNTRSRSSTLETTCELSNIPSSMPDNSLTNLDHSWFSSSASSCITSFLTGWRNDSSFSSANPAGEDDIFSATGLSTCFNGNVPYFCTDCITEVAAFKFVELIL